MRESAVSAAPRRQNQPLGGQKMSASTASQRAVITVALAVLVLAGVLLDTPPAQREGNAPPLPVVQAPDSQTKTRWDPAKVWEELTKRRDRRYRSRGHQSPQQVLNEVTECDDFVDTPLQDAVEFLADLHNTNIVLDEVAFADVEINYVVSGMRLSEVLQTILKPLKLKYQIEDESIRIITDAAQQ